MKTIVIVGANVTGGRAAETLRQEGFDGRIILIGAEPDRPYERPPLSKEFLSGERAEDTLYLRSPDYYAQQDIALWLDTHVMRLDPAARTVKLADGRQFTYDDLLIATGAAPRHLDVPGADLAGVLYLRTLRDAQQLRQGLTWARRVVVVGAGFIGAEVAASCRRAGLEVVVLEAAAVPLERALGRQVGDLYLGIHRDHGVDLRTNQRVVCFRGQGRVEQVVTAAGALDCDFVVVGVGVAPACDWLAGSGIVIDNGVVVDEYCRTTLPHVYAAGDVATWWHPILKQRLRVEHFDNAQNQGVAAARSLLGRGEPYAPIPYFWSDQYDLRLQYVGQASGQAVVVLRGTVEAGSWSAFYLQEGRLQAALAVNRPKDVAAARKLIASRALLTPEQLADDDVDLRALARRVESSVSADPPPSSKGPVAAWQMLPAEPPTESPVA